MPTIVRDGEFTFVIHMTELPFEPPHVHVWFGVERVRIELVGMTFMDRLPAGKRRAILAALRRNSVTIARMLRLTRRGS